MVQVDDLSTKVRSQWNYRILLRYLNSTMNILARKIGLLNRGLKILNQWLSYLERRFKACFYFKSIQYSRNFALLSIKGELK